MKKKISHKTEANILLALIEKSRTLGISLAFCNIDCLTLKRATSSKQLLVIRLSTAFIIGDTSWVVSSFGVPMPAKFLPLPYVRYFFTKWTSKLFKTVTRNFFCTPELEEFRPLSVVLPFLHLGEPIARNNCPQVCNITLESFYLPDSSNSFNLNKLLILLDIKALDNVFTGVYYRP